MRPLLRNDSTVLTGNAVDEVPKLKREQNEAVLVAGSSQLLRTLIEHDLLRAGRVCAQQAVKDHVNVSSTTALCQIQKGSSPLESTTRARGQSVRASR
jgi:hypothetical protein